MNVLKMCIISVLAMLISYNADAEIRRKLVERKCDFNREVCIANLNILLNSFLAMQAKGVAYAVKDLDSGKIVAQEYMSNAKINYLENYEYIGLETTQFINVILGLNYGIISVNDLNENRLDFKDNSKANDELLFKLKLMPQRSTPLEYLEMYSEFIQNPKLKDILPVLHNKIEKGFLSYMKVKGVDMYGFSDFSTDDEVGTVYIFLGHFEKNNKRYAIVSVVDSPDKNLKSKKSKKDSNSMESALIEAIAKNM